MSSFDTSHGALPWPIMVARQKPATTIIQVHLSQCWGNLVTCNLSYVIFITFEANSNITKLHFSQVICNCNNITLRGDTMYVL